MVQKRKTRLVIGVKPKALGARERERLRKALRTVISIMDQHDLTTINLDGVTSAQRNPYYRK